MVSGPFDSGVVTEGSGASISISEAVFAGPNFWAGVSGMVVMFFIISSLPDDVSVENPVKGTSEGLLLSCWHPVVKYSSITIGIFARWHTPYGHTKYAWQYA